MTYTLYKYSELVQVYSVRSVVRSAEFIIGRELPALQDTYHTRCLRKTGRILKDCYHPAAFWKAVPQHPVSHTQTGEQLLPQGHQAAKWTLILHRHFCTRHFTYTVTVTFILLFALRLHILSLPTYCLHYL